MVVVILVFQCGVEAHSAQGLLSAPPPALLLAMELLPPCSTSPAVGGESAVGGEPVVAGQPAQLDLEHIGLAVGTGSGPTDPSAVQRPDTDCTADDNDGSDMMLFPPTPTSTQPPSPRPAEPPQSALPNFESEESVAPVEESSEEESEGPIEGFYLRHNYLNRFRCNFNGFNNQCACEGCLRAFALILRKRAEAIIVYSMSGKEHRIETLTSNSTFFDFYQQARTVLGLALEATSTSVALLVFLSARPNCNIRPDGGAQFSPGEILEPSRVKCKHLLVGCCFQAVITGGPPQVVMKAEDFMEEVD